MKTFRLAAWALAAALFSSIAAAGDAAPPKTAAEEVRETLHGVEILDPYRWLEDQEGPRTRQWIDQQNAWTRSVLDPRPDREAIAKRLEALLRVDTVSVPREASGRYFFTRRSKDADLPVLYVRRGLKGKDEVLLDPRPLSADGSVSTTLMDISKDGKWIAYGVREGGEDEVLVRFRDVDTKKDLPDVLPKGRYSGVAFDGNRGGVYYSRRIRTGPRVFLHRMGADPAADEQVFGEGYAPDKIIVVGVAGGRWLVATVLHGSAAKKTEVYARDLSRPEAKLFTVVDDIDARFTAAVGGDTMFLNTNWNAPNGRVLAVSLTDPDREKWKQVVPEGKGSIQGIAAAGGKIFVNTIEDVQERIRVFQPDGKPAEVVSFPTLGSLSTPAGRWESPEAFFSFTSFTTPSMIWRYDTKKGKRSEWAKRDVPFDPSLYEVRQVWYPSKDGTRIPMFLAHRKGLKLDGKNPTYLYGYGGFTLSQLPSFSALKAVWMERGGVYALANLRGGGEFGEEWHRAGMLERKQNTFDDFIAAAQWLIAEKYTAPEHLAIGGGSNGGLLVGAALTQRPDLFAAVICSYPLLDMIRYHQFLVASYWIPEYGSSENAEQFRWLKAYSPYHNVQPGQKYPAVLFITGDSDTRVAPLHARKMAARLQGEAAPDPGRPILLLYDTKAGHTRGMNTPVPKQVADQTDELSFLLWKTGSGP